MRDVGFDPIWDAWTSGGPFIGDFAPHAVVTVEKDWGLHLQLQAGSYPKCPIRWWQSCDASQVETEIPNVKSLAWDRNQDTDAAQLTLQIYNTAMFQNALAGSSSTRLGQPGFFTWRIGNSEAQARWGPPPGMEWARVLTPDALLRTYQGYGGKDKTLDQALADGNLAMTGAWLVDRVTVKTDGMIELKARDPGKLLIEQHLYPPLVPRALYPAGLRYQRWQQKDVTVTNTIASAGLKRCVYQRVGVSAASGSDIWAGGFDGRMAGHYPHEAFDGRADTFWLSTGNDTPWEPFAVEWIEAACGDYIDTVRIFPIGNNYRVYISVMEGGAWVDGGHGTIAYDPLTIGRYTGADTASIPYVAQVGASEALTDIRLPRAYRADKVRITMTGLQRVPYPNGVGPFTYRGGLREIGLILANPVTDTSIQHVIEDGNFKDYTEIIKDLALWSGFSCFDPADPAAEAEVYGNLEFTGIPDSDHYSIDTDITVSEYDLLQKPVIDAMHTIRDIVGFLIWIDEEGGFHFESANWYRSGNFRLDGTPTDFIPDIDERVQMTEYLIDYSDNDLASEIIISSNEPTAGFSDTVTTYYTLPGGEDNVLRGIVKTRMLINQTLTNPAEQRTFAKLLGLKLIAATYQGQLTCAANPCISMNDQIRIHEQITAETGIHYVKGISCQQDLDSGQFMMTVTTFRLGDDVGFQVTPA